MGTSMKTFRTVGRILLPASLVMLAACQTTPRTAGTTSSSAPAAQAPATATPAPTAPTQQDRQQASSQGASVAVFLADTVAQPGWTPVTVPSGSLYINPEPVVTRADLTGIQAGSNNEGDGLLALELNETGKQRVNDITGKNPNKRLALVVGRTMLAAPSYTTAVSSGQLVFVVGTEQNATAAARAIAGVDEQSQGAPPAGSPARTPSTAPRSPSTGAGSPGVPSPVR